MADRTRCFFGAAFLAFFFGIFFLTLLIEKDNAISASKQECSIEQVTYTRNITDRENMVRCDCGRNCWLDEGTCGKVFLSTKGIINQMALPDVKDSNLGFECTFQEKRCKEVLRSVALEKIKQETQPYIDLMDSNSTIDCYVLDGNVYLNNTFDSELFIAITVVFTLFLCCCAGIGCCITCDERTSSSSTSHMV